MCFLLMTLVLVLILNPLLDFFLVYQADVSIFYTSNLYWWGKGWPVDGLPFPDTGCPVPDVSIYYMSNINELPDGILFHWFCRCTPPWMFLPLDIPSEYRPEHVTFGLLCVIFKFPSRIFCRRVPGFATDWPLRCLVPWINHLPPVCWSTFGILVWNDSGYVNLTQWWYFFIIFEYILHISTPHIMIFCFPLPYFPLSTSALFFA